jgi:hypothetical protein
MQKSINLKLSGSKNAKKLKNLNLYKFTTIYVACVERTMLTTPKKKINSIFMRCMAFTS